MTNRRRIFVVTVTWIVLFAGTVGAVIAHRRLTRPEPTTARVSPREVLRSLPTRTQPDHLVDYHELDGRFVSALDEGVLTIKEPLRGCKAMIRERTGPREVESEYFELSFRLRTGSVAPDDVLLERGTLELTDTEAKCVTDAFSTLTLPVAASDLGSVPEQRVLFQFCFGNWTVAAFDLEGMKQTLTTGENMRKLLSKLAILALLASAPVAGMAITAEPAQACVYCSTPTTCSNTSNDAFTTCWVSPRSGCMVSGICIA